jgi:hypothetical protein
MQSKAQVSMKIRRCECLHCDQLRTIIWPKSVTLHWRVTYDARHTVEVGVAAGQVGQTLMLHDCND